MEFSLVHTQQRENSKPSAEVKKLNQYQASHFLSQSGLVPVYPEIKNNK